MTPLEVTQADAFAMAEWLDLAAAWKKPGGTTPERRAKDQHRMLSDAAAMLRKMADTIAAHEVAKPQVTREEELDLLAHAERLRSDAAGRREIAGSGVSAAPPRFHEAEALRLDGLADAILHLPTQHGGGHD